MEALKYLGLLSVLYLRLWGHDRLLPLHAPLPSHLRVSRAGRSRKTRRHLESETCSHSRLPIFGYLGTHYPLDTHLKQRKKEKMVHTKGPAPQVHDGGALRIGIIHARWNDTIIEPLLAGTKAKLLECGVKESNIVVQTVPGSWELPIAVQRCASPSPPRPPPL